MGEPEERLSRIGELEREVAAARDQADAAVALAEQALALAEHRPAPAPTERSELDDSAQPPATIALDGRFESINPAFESLWATREADFRHARWPSLADREHACRSIGRCSPAWRPVSSRAPRVETVYMHGQGLTVPVKGSWSSVRSEGGAPRHLLLSVDHG